MMIDRRLFLLAGAALASGCLARPAQDAEPAPSRRIDVDFGPSLPCSARAAVSALPRWMSPPAARIRP
jgi:hypothetical protein